MCHVFSDKERPIERSRTRTVRWRRHESSSLESDHRAFAYGCTAKSTLEAGRVGTCHKAVAIPVPLYAPTSPRKEQQTTISRLNDLRLIMMVRSASRSLGSADDGGDSRNPGRA